MDDLIPYLVYWPEWHKRMDAPGTDGAPADGPKQVYADQISF